VRNPQLLIRLAMRDAAILALGSRRVIPDRAIAMGYTFAWTDLRAVLRDVLSS
jgi:NAD dependent epimerase/dehydratase family enzyme